MTSILLITDDAEASDALGRFFERSGRTVARAAAGAAGIETYEREGPDLVLLDLVLPDLPGIQVLRRLRERDADATVLVLASNADIAAAVDAMRLGAENFLTKPVAPTHLEAAVERALEKADLRRRWRLLAADEVELSLAEVERRHIHRVLLHHGGNRSRAARALGISRATLYEKIRRYGLEGAGRGGAA